MLHLSVLLYFLAGAFNLNDDAAMLSDPSVVERYYKGSVAYTRDNREYTIERVMMLKIFQSKVSGTFQTTITIKGDGEYAGAGKEYVSIGVVSGSYDNKKKKLHIAIDSYNKADRLPGDGKWCKGKITFKVSERSSYGYQLSGIMKDDCKNEYVIML